MKTTQIVMKLFPAGATEPKWIGRFDVPFGNVFTEEDYNFFFSIEQAINTYVAGRVHIEVVQRFAADDLDRRVTERIGIANRLSMWISHQTSIPTHPSFIDAHVANQLLHDVIVEQDQLTRAATSLVIGVEELAAYWPDEDLRPGHPLNDLIGFLFATLPLSQKALGRK